jgi:hypothetical protein
MYQMKNRIAQWYGGRGQVVYVSSSVPCCTQTALSLPYLSSTIREEDQPINR